VLCHVLDRKIWTRSTPSEAFEVCARSAGQGHLPLFRHLLCFQTFCVEKYVTLGIVLFYQIKHSYVYNDQGKSLLNHI
jgi:hypothetical protein